MKSFISKRAFTLAEVLITLAIIGVVAAMTIPSLMQSTQKQDTVAKVKKSYSILSQATESIKTECGGNLTNCLTNPIAANDDATARQEVASLYKSKLLVNKDCTGTGIGCFANVAYKSLNGNNAHNYESESFCANARLVLNDGNAVCFDWSGATTYLFSVWIDTNGSQQPNQEGKDLFLFYYDSTLGVIKPSMSADCTTTGLGHGCAGKIIQEGAINYY